MSARTTTANPMSTIAQAPPALTLTHNGERTRYAPATRLIQSCGRVQGRVITSAMSAHILFPLIDTHPPPNFTLAAFARRDEGPRSPIRPDFRELRGGFAPGWAGQPSVET